MFLDRILFKLHPTIAHKKAQKPREAKPSFRALLSKLDRIIQSNKTGGKTQQNKSKHISRFSAQT